MRRSFLLVAALLGAALPPAAAAAAAQVPAESSPPETIEVPDSAAWPASETTARARASRRRSPEPGWTIGAWAGGAPTSYSGHFIGATPGRPVALFGVRLGSVRAQLGPVGVEYVAQLIPAAFAYDNPVGPLTESCASLQRTNVRRGVRTAMLPDYCRRRVYGAGAMPLGVQLNTSIGSWARAFVAGSAGALVFAENMPIPQARRLNVAFDFGGGLEFGRRHAGAVTLGYKLHHISNAWTAEANPGIDHHVLYLGFIRRMGSAHRIRRPASGSGVPTAVAPADTSGGATAAQPAPERR